VLLVAFIVAAVFTALGVPLARRRIPPNGWYGLRIAATLSDEDVWYEMNARAGRHFLHFATWLPVLAIALRGLSPWLGSGAADAIFWGVLVCGVIGMAVWDIREADRLLALKRAGRWPPSTSGA
jgi:hypothetical protein